jgi:two-component system, NarL family, nitrate/nitrite response regulator NarL
MNETGNFDFSKEANGDERLRILLVDDHTMLLEGINTLLANQPNLKVVAKASNGEAAIQQLKSIRVDLIVTDLNMPGLDGVALYNQVKSQFPLLKVIVLSMHDEVHIVKDLLRAGVNGYVLKKDTHTELLKAIDEVCAGKVYVSSEVNKVLVEDLQHDGEKPLLTTRELEIVRLIVKEYSNKRIAEELFISERTVETHRKNILRKTRVGSIVGLIKYAYANKLV